MADAYTCSKLSLDSLVIPVWVDIMSTSNGWVVKSCSLYSAYSWSSSAGHYMVEGCWNNEQSQPLMAQKPLILFAKWAEVAIRLTRYMTRTVYAPKNNDQLCDILGICRACKTVRFAVIPFHVKSSTTLVCTVISHRFEYVN